MFASATEALPGASAVFLNSRALGGQLEEVVAECGRAGVGKLVALSAINADDDLSRQPSRFRGDRNREVERLAVDSGLAWVSLRPSVFASNFAGMWSAQLRAGDVVAGPYAAASTAPIVETDIAAVAARALLTDELAGQRIPLTGPQAFTNSELVGVIGAVLGRLPNTWRSPRTLCGNASWAWDSAPDSPTPTSPCSPNRSTSPRWSPTTSRKSSAARPFRSATGSPSTATSSPTRTREPDMTEPRPRATSSP